MIDLNEMAIFARVVEAGSFTEAGRQLGLPKSTISRKVSQLEERLGVQLMERTTRSLSLTDTGTAYYRYCNRIISEAEEADNMASDRLQIPSGRLKITAPPGFHFLTDVVVDFLEAYEKVSIELNMDKRMLDLVEEGYDVAFRVGPLIDSSLIGRYLSSVKLILCASPSYLEKHGVPQTMEDLKKHTAIEGIQWEFENEKHSQSFQPKARISVNENNMARSLALKGLGMTVLSEMICSADLKNGDLIPLLPQHPLAEKKVYLLYPANRHLPAKVRKFIEFVTERWHETSPWYHTI